MDVYFKPFNLNLTISNTDTVFWAGLYGLCTPSVPSGSLAHLSPALSVGREKQIKPLHNWTSAVEEWNQLSIVSCLFQHSAPCTCKGQQLNGDTLGIPISNASPKRNLQHSEQTVDKHKAGYRFRKEKISINVIIYLHLPKTMHTSEWREKNKRICFHSTKASPNKHHS